MAQPAIQTSFHRGELSPLMFARVDMKDYHAGLALCRNFFIDRRGGVSTRAGTKYVIQCYKPGTKVRLIPFQASFTVNYILEFGDRYVRFINNGAAVLESSFAITGATQANPCVLTVTGNNFNPGDWIFVTGVTGMTQLNGKYFLVLAVSGASVTLGNILDGSNINSTAYTAYSSGGTAARVYTLPSPYAAADLALLKFAQNVNTLIICHPNYQPYLLTLISATNWTLNPVSFGPTILAPTSTTAVISSTTVGSVAYSYVVTSVDPNGQESAPSTAATLASKADYTTTPATVTISWSAATGAQFYNVYRAQLSYAGAVPAGAQFGFVGFTTGTSLIDTNTAPDYSLTPPIIENPFLGSPVQSVVVNTAGTYTNNPTPLVTIDPPSSGATATASAVQQIQGTPTIATSTAGFSPGDIVTNATSTGTSAPSLIGNVSLVVATTSGGAIATFRPITWPGSSPGAFTSTSVNSTPTITLSDTHLHSCTAHVVWGIGQVNVISNGAGYTSVPNVTFSAGAAAATAVLGEASAGNPSLPIYFDQRLYLMAPPGAVQTFYASQPGSYYNFNISNPTQDSDAITGSLVSASLNTLKSAVIMSQGMILFGDKQAWLINGGSPGAAPTPIDITANSQAYNGASDLPLIVANYDVLYVQAKGSIVRDLTFNFYLSNYTGLDLSTMSSQLFFGYTLSEWAFAEEPFKVVWIVRSDGTLLSLTFVKEQEIVGWAHHDTNGAFQSIATVPEQVSFGTVDAIYTVVQRTINGTTTQYIERMAERLFASSQNSWCVDAGLQYNGAPATTFTGLDHLEGASITGTADGLVVPPTTVVNGSVTLGVAASLVTLGLAFTPQIQTLPIDLGEPTVQGKRKKITAATVRCYQTFGLAIGHQTSTLVNMKDCAVPSVANSAWPVDNSSQSPTSQVLNARTLVDPLWDVPGQYLIQQSNPYPATILGVIPELTVGDTPK